MDSIKGKVAVITGAASGIGLGMVRAFLKEGAQVAMLDFDEEALQAAVKSLEFRPGQALPFLCDVTNRDQLQTIAGKVDSAFGRVDILCNNAGIAIGGAIDATSFEMWDWALDVNLGGVINGMQTFVPLILKHGEGGHIVNTGSILSLFSMAGQAVYSASKYAVLGLSEAARHDLADKGVGVSVLLPGLIATNIIKSLAERPIELAGGGGASAELNDAHKLYQEKGLSPDTVGLQVLNAIKINEPYIFTDRQQVDMVKDRFASVLEGFEHINPE